MLCGTWSTTAAHLHYIDQVIGNISKAFYVDDVGYDIFDAENVVRIFYESVVQGRLNDVGVGEKRRKVASASTSKMTEELSAHLNNSSRQVR